MRPAQRRNKHITNNRTEILMSTLCPGIGEVGVGLMGRGSRWKSPGRAHLEEEYTHYKQQNWDAHVYSLPRHRQGGKIKRGGGNE